MSITGSRSGTCESSAIRTNLNSHEFSDGRHGVPGLLENRDEELLLAGDVLDDEHSPGRDFPGNLPGNLLLCRRDTGGDRVGWFNKLRVSIHRDASQKNVRPHFWYTIST